MKYLKLICGFDLLTLVLGQFLVKYALFEPFNVPITLNWFGLALLSLATVCLGAGGSIMNVFHTSKITPPISAKMTYKLFFIVNIIGVGIGFYLANIIGHPGFSTLFILTSAALYANATILKKYVLLSPLIISVLIGISLLSVGLFDLLPALSIQDKATSGTFFSILLDYSIFIAVLNFIRLLVTQQENIDTAHKLKHHTLALILGKERTNKVIAVLCLLPIFGIGFYIFNYLYLHTLSLVYAIVFILGPLLYLIIKIVSAKKDNEYAQLNTVLKFIMFCSILSLGLYQFILL